MKRGLITWNKEELPPVVFERRLDAARKVLIARDLPALVVYSDLWRSNQGRYFANFMPYFNRAFLILPLDGKPTLLCGLSPRTYRWIQSVTPIEDVRSAGNFIKPLSEIAAERGWTRIGMLDAGQLPFDLAKTLHSGPLEIVNISSRAVFNPAEDENEIALRRKAAALARGVLEEEIAGGVGELDHHLVGRLERRLRRAGAEDLVILLTNGDGPPAPASDQTLRAGYSVSLALEYRGHWVRISRANGIEDLKEMFLRQVQDALVVESLSGSYPYECGDDETLRAVHIQTRRDGQRLYYGDTCWRGPMGWEIL